VRIERDVKLGDSTVNDHVASTAKTLDVVRRVVAGVAVNVVAICRFLYFATLALVK